MKIFLKFVLLFPLLASVVCGAETNTTAVPASSNVPGAEYPKIYPDRSVTFRFKAPKAQTVSGCISTNVTRWSATRTACGR